jgi:hypothetical protein
VAAKALRNAITLYARDDPVRSRAPRGLTFAEAELHRWGLRRTYYELCDGERYTQPLRAVVVLAAPHADGIVEAHSERRANAATRWATFSGRRSP